MSVKAIKEQFEKSYEVYHELLEVVRDVEEAFQNKIASPEMLEQVQTQVTIAKDAYDHWSFVMFLLNQPQRKSKQAAYARRNKKLLEHASKENSPEAQIARSKKAVDTLRGMIE